MEAVFTEEMIREELRRLDKITGSHGADLPIKFGNSKSRLGYFSYGNEYFGFYFSNYYLMDTNFPVEGKMDLIRHEYAHYLDYTRRNRSGTTRIGGLVAILQEQDLQGSITNEFLIFS